MNVLFIAPVGLNTSTGNADAVHGGYGNAAFNTLKILHLLKEEKQINDLFVLDISNKYVSDEVIKNLKNSYDVCICVVNPVSLVEDGIYLKFIKNYMGLAKKRYLQIAWETKGFPKGFDKLFKDTFFTGFLAPSLWGCEQLKNKTKQKVFYYPHFVDSNNFSLIDLDEKEKEKKFTVLYLGQYTYRKGIQDALIAFLRALGTNEDCELILKYRRLSDKEVDPEIYLRSLIHCNVILPKLKANIKYLDQSLSNEELGNIYDISSVLLFPTRGEGFGLPIAECMLQGLPIIYTNWSACKEVGESEFNYPISYYVDEAYNMTHYKYEYGLKYAVPSISDMINKLEFLYDLWKKDKVLYYKKFQKNREIVEKKYGASTIKKTILNILNDNEEFLLPEKQDKEKGFNNKRTEFLNLKKFAEIGEDEENYKWILRENSYCDGILQDEVGANINHEKSILDEIRSLSSTYSLFIDVGAHVGYYSIRLHKYFEYIFAIEPNVNNYQGLATNIILNKIYNVQAIPELLSDQEKEVYLINKGSSSYISNKKEGMYCSMKTSIFDTLFLEVLEKNKCIIKLDVEGSELDILKGAEKSLSFNSLWVIEWHNNLRKEIINYMSKFGFKIKKEFSDIKKIIFEKK